MANKVVHKFLLTYLLANTSRMHWRWEQSSHYSGPSLTPENYAGTLKFGMPGVHCTPKMNSPALLDAQKLLPWRPADSSLAN